MLTKKLVILPLIRSYVEDRRDLKTPEHFPERICQGFIVGAPFCNELESQCICCQLNNSSNQFHCPSADTGKHWGWAKRGSTLLLLHSEGKDTFDRRFFERPSLDDRTAARKMPLLGRSTASKLRRSRFGIGTQQRCEAPPVHTQQERLHHHHDNRKGVSVRPQQRVIQQDVDDHRRQ